MVRLPQHRNLTSLVLHIAPTRQSHCREETKRSENNRPSHRVETTRRDSTSHLAHPDYHHKKYRLLHLRLFVCTHLITHSKKAGCRPIDLVKSNLDLDCSLIVIGSLNNRIKLKLRIIVVVSQRIRDRAIKRPRINIETPHYQVLRKRS